MLSVVVGLKGSSNVKVLVLVVVISGALESARAWSFTYNPAHSRAWFCKVRSAEQQGSLTWNLLKIQTLHSLLPDLGIRVCAVARSPGHLHADYSWRSAGLVGGL